MRANYLAGGTNTPIPIPRYYPQWIKGGKGAYVYDIKNKKYIDLWMGYGALLLGHTDIGLIHRITERLKDGWFFSIPSELELDVAELIHKLVPSAEKIRFATTGSDAVAYAVRVARTYTSRKHILSIIGGYHGVHEGFVQTSGIIDSLRNFIDYIPFNDIESAEKYLRTRKYAAILTEPVLANAGCTPPEENYLWEMRELCNQTDTLLIFDEIVTGFRLDKGGAQTYFGVVPDISIFSKALANGLPLAAIVGKEEIMNCFYPKGNVFFAGTFNAHPLSLCAAKYILEKISKENFHEKINKMGKELREFIIKEIDSMGIFACVQGIGSMLTITFGCEKFEQGLYLTKFSEDLYYMFIENSARLGVLFPPLPTETVFLSPVHELCLPQIKDIIRKSLEAIRNVSQRKNR